MLELLNLHREQYEEVQFDRRRYSALTTRRERVCYAVNINGARNAAIASGRQRFEFIACLDQDCFFTPELWQEVLSFLKSDQRKEPTRQYYGLAMKRTLGDVMLPIDHRLLPDGEPQLILRRDAPLWFDPNIAFGEGDKTGLLHKLGYGSGPGFPLMGDRCRTAGTVLHFAAGNSKSERDVLLRMRVRAQSIDQLLDNLDRRYGSYGIAL